MKPDHDFRAAPFAFESMQSSCGIDDHQSPLADKLFKQSVDYRHLDSCPRATSGLQIHDVISLSAKGVIGRSGDMNMRIYVAQCRSGRPGCAHLGPREAS